MKNTTKAIIPALFSFAVMSAQTLSADVFDFSGATPVYDDYRSTTEETEGKHYYFEYEHNILGFNYMNANWGTAQSPSWYYQWDGINVSTANDPNADVSKYWEAGQKASYTSQNALDASGVSGGAYGVFYGNGQYPVTGHSESDNCMGMKEDDPGINHEFGFIIFDDLVNFQ
ncbi:MAG: hypothetical protein IJI37_00570, partial [Opitutales bacterium]|nr:hypothetical protein [Opitutales bacterium]